MEEKKDIRAIFEQFVQGDYSAVELKEILTRFQVDQSGDALEMLIDEYLDKPEAVDAADEDAIDDIVSELDKTVYAIVVPEEKVVSISKKRKFLFLSYAAASTLLFAFLSYWAYQTLGLQNDTSVLKSKFGDDVVVGENKAMLKLENGETIYLDQSKGGILIDGSHVSYQGESAKLADLSDLPVSNLVLSTPRGSQYQVRLPDGSRVWLNAASSLEYPSRFVNNERRVKLTGEGYFEVEKDASKPFLVETDGQVVKVLGTTFNINAYQESADQRTTLLEGRVQVSSSSSGKDVVLQPGQEAVQTAAKLLVQSADVSSTIGWKNGEFVFHYASLRELMFELTRWYDLEVNLSEIPDEVFYAEVDRDQPLSSILTMLESTSNLTFEIKGRRLIVKEKE